MRPTWDQYFMEITEVVAKRSTCMRRHVGATIVKDKHVLASGYNGAPSGLDHCSKTGCMRELMQVPRGERHELCRGLHAEQNAIIQAAVHGVQIQGGTLYSTTFPCVLCAKMLINAGIRRIVYKGNYPDELSSKILQEADVEVINFEQV